MDQPRKAIFQELPFFTKVLQLPPTATALIEGSTRYPDISGEVYFYQTPKGVLVAAQVFGLPDADEACKASVFAFHIHAGESCTGNADDPFADTMTHYNPHNCPHPAHAGDLLPLWSNRSAAFEVFLTDRFTVAEVMGKTVVVHANFDDFSSQPAGNAGEKIACGVIR